MKVVHDVLAQLEDREAGVQGAVERELRLQEVDCSHRLKLFEGVELRPVTIFPNGLLVGHQLDLGSLPLVLHCFSEDGVVHQFEKVVFKRIGSFLALLGVEPNIWLEPCQLGEGEDAMDSRQLHPEIYALLKITVVDDVFGLVAEVRHELRGRATDAELIV